MDSRHRISFIEQEFAALRALIRRVETGEEQERLATIVEHPEWFSEGEVADARRQSEELSSEDARMAFSDVLRSQMAGLDREREGLRRRAADEAHDGDEASSRQPRVEGSMVPTARPTGVTVGAACRASVGALVAAALCWVGVGIVFAFANGQASPLLKAHPWLGLVTGVGLACVFAAAAATILERPVSVVAVAFLVLAAGVVADGPDTVTWIGLAALVPASTAALWIGTRHVGPSLRGRSVEAAPVLLGGAVACAVIAAGAVAVYPHAAGAESATSGAESSFCSTHHCISSFDEGTGSIVQCADGMWSHSGGRPGACSYHGGEASTGATPAAGVPAEPVASAGPTDSAADSSPVPTATPSPRVAIAAEQRANADVRSAAAAVRAFYDDLSLQDYGAAWGRLTPGLQAQLGSYAAWKRGYSDTLSNELGRVTVQLAGLSDATASATLTSADLDACGGSVHRRWALTWALSREAGQWRARSISTAKVSGRDPAKRLADCAPAPDPSSLRDSTSTPCSQHSCTQNFDAGRGAIGSCGDGTYTHSAGIQGACSYHGGLLSPSPTRPSASLPSGSGTVQVQGYVRSDGTYVHPYTRRSPSPTCFSC